MDRDDADLFWMRRAVELAGRAAGRTSPNPLVGCVIVRDGLCVGEGYHARAGAAHAEAAALEDAGDRAVGATAYVTLEPCAHWGRTPPCVDALVGRGVPRVVSAMEDPDERNRGRGHQGLRESGVEVETGVLEAEARRLNAPYLTWKQRGTPHVTLKLAASLDGKAATSSGESRWITGAEAQLDGHGLRDRTDAILVGIGTVLADDPALTTRLPDRDDVHQPIRVIVDSQARTPGSARVLVGRDVARTVIAVGEGAEATRVEALRALGAAVWHLPCDEDGVSLGALLGKLGEHDVLSLLVEGGPRVAGTFVKQRRVDRVVAYVGARLIGGVEALGSVGGAGIPALANALRLSVADVRRVGSDVRIEADVVEDET